MFCATWRIAYCYLLHGGNAYTCPRHRISIFYRGLIATPRRREKFYCTATRTVNPWFIRRDVVSRDYQGKFIRSMSAWSITLLIALLVINGQVTGCINAPPASTRVRLKYLRGPAYVEITQIIVRGVFTGVRQWIILINAMVVDTCFHFVGIACAFPPVNRRKTQSECKDEEANTIDRSILLLRRFRRVTFLSFFFFQNIRIWF